MAAVRALGAVEVAGALGLVLPPATGVAPWLALLAAVGLLVLQVGAVRVHRTSTDDRSIVLNVALIIVAAVVIGLATTWWSPPRGDPRTASTAPGRQRG